jgi:hypothetical protein
LRQIELYLDDELVGFERVEVERHLGGCDPCTGHADFQRRLKEMLRDKCGCRDVPPESPRTRSPAGPAEPPRPGRRIGFVTKATRPGRLPPPSRTEQEGRICGHDGCRTKLSVYNAGSSCWQHADLVFPSLRGKRLRTDRT